MYLLIAIFALQAVYFSAVINYKVPSDEEFHFLLTKYHAERPLVAGPIISDQTTNFMLGDIQRMPSYLYHYVTSFYLRVVMAFTGNQETQVFMLRLLNVGIGVAVLCMIVRVFRRLNKSQLSINLTIAWLTFTGMFVWVFAALSYDNLAMLLFFYLIYELLGLKDTLNIKHLLISIVTALALVLVKETYVPITILGFLLLLGWHLKHNKIKGINGQLRASLKNDWKRVASRRLIIFLSLLVIVFAGLFLERYGQNYVRYGKVTPNCDQVHSVNECMQNSIYRRNTGQRKEFIAAKKAGTTKLDHLGIFTKNWLVLIYERTYFYRGHQTIISNNLSKKVGFVSVILIVLLLLYNFLTARNISSISVALLVLTIVYILLVFLYNLNTYRFYGYPFAIQGRYLLPVVPFLYMGIVTALLAFYNSRSHRMKPIVIIIVVMLIAINVAVHAPIVIYRNGHDILDQPVVSLAYLNKAV